MDESKDYYDNDELKNRFTAWLETVLKNAKLNYLHKELKRIRTMISLENYNTDEFWCETEEARCEDFFFENEKVYNAYKELSDMQKKVLTMLFIQDMSIVEISKTLGVSYAYVKKVKCIAIKKLRKKLEGETR